VVVAVVVVRRVQAAGDEEVRVVAVRHGFVPAAFPVDMAALVSGRRQRVARRVAVVHGNPVLVDVIAVRVVQAAVVQVVDMVLVEHREVPAVGPVPMVVALVNLVSFVHAVNATARNAVVSSTCR
jgi:hypothetical protein